MGHANFYKRFIKDFSYISNPLYKLLQHDTTFEFDDVVNSMKITPIKYLMCGASNNQATKING